MGRHRGRNDRQAAPAVGEKAKDIALDAVIVRNDVESILVAFAVSV